MGRPAHQRYRSAAVTRPNDVAIRLLGALDFWRAPNLLNTPTSNRQSRMWSPATAVFSLLLDFVAYWLVRILKADE